VVITRRQNLTAQSEITTFGFEIIRELAPVNTAFKFSLTTQPQQPRETTELFPSHNGNFCGRELEWLWVDTQHVFSIGFTGAEKRVQRKILYLLFEEILQISGIDFTPDRKLEFWGSTLSGDLLCLSNSVGSVKEA